MFEFFVLYVQDCRVDSDFLYNLILDQIFDIVLICMAQSLSNKKFELRHLQKLYCNFQRKNDTYGEQVAIIFINFKDISKIFIFLPSFVQENYKYILNLYFFFKSKMTCKQTISKIIKSFDFFTQPITLRYKQQPNYTTISGGLISLIMLALFIGIFFNTFLNTIQKHYIFSQMNYREETDPNYLDINTSQFLFAISISGIDLVGNQKYFDINFKQRINKKNQKIKITYSLQKCKKSQWSRHGEQFTKLFDKLGMQNWLCPNDNMNINLVGKYSSQQFKFWQISVSKCKDTDLSYPCANDTKLDNFFKGGQNLVLNFYFINKLLNPSSEEFINEYLEDRNYFELSANRLITNNLFVSDFQIETDDSIWPIQISTFSSGGIVKEPLQTFSSDKGILNQQYIKIYIRKSSTNLSIHRQFRKIDDTLSYIGGLFSALITLLFFIKAYNQYSYQYEIAGYMFKYNSDEQIDDYSFNFVKFIKYLCYQLLVKWGISVSWVTMEKLHNVLEQSRNQLDIRLLLQKIMFTQRAIDILMEKQQIELIHLQEPKRICQMEENRLKYQLYQTKIKNRQLQTKKHREPISIQRQQQDNQKPDYLQPDALQSDYFGRILFNAIKTKQATSKQQVSQENQIKPPQEQVNNIFNLVMQSFEKAIFIDQHQRQAEVSAISQDIQETLEYLKQQIQNGDKMGQKLFNSLGPQLKKIFTSNLVKRQKPIFQIIQLEPSDIS